jgi:hypothetical protein
MILLNHDLKAIYIHVPKCGGIYVAEILIQFYNFIPLISCYHCDKPPIINSYFFEDKIILNVIKDGIVKTAQNLLPDTVWSTYTKFTFVRNPYERALSGYLFSKKTYDDVGMHSQINLDHPGINIFENMNNVFKYMSIAFPYFYYHTMLSQSHHLLNKNNEIDINHIYNFDNIDGGLNEILCILGVTNIQLHKNIPKQNATIKEHNITYYFDDETINYINTMCEKDFINFNCKKFENKDDMMKYYNC